jgi:hypothetical protein
MFSWCGLRVNRQSASLLRRGRPKSAEAGLLDSETNTCDSRLTV